MQQVQTTLPAGSIVGERYQVEKLLGKGGFGAVYLVHDLRVRQNVFALKEIIDPDQRERRHFTMETDLLKRTDHPSLPRVYRSFDDPTRGRAYMLMDYIEGSNLENLRRQQSEQRLSPREALALIGPIVEAIIYLHSQQPPIIHRDIKPSNIIVPTSGERTMLVDFGIAKEFDQEATTTVIRHATPGYGAPEQYGTGTDTRTDIYGLGATLYTLLTGSPPVDAFFRMTQQMSQKGDPLQPVKQHVPAIPAYISDAIARAMALEKNERFATVQDFWQALQPEAVATSENGVGLASPVVQVKPLYRPTPELLSVPSRSRGKWVAISLLILLALSVGFAAALVALPKLHGQQTNVSTATPGITATHVATATPTPSSRPTQAATPTTQPTTTPTTQPTNTPANSIPTLATTYTGTITDTLGSLNASMSLRGITQNGENIRGTFNVVLPLSGNGPFTGTVKSNASIQFIVHSTDANVRAPLFFSGQIQANNSMNGWYCSLNAAGSCDHTVGGYGTWSVQPG